MHRFDHHNSVIDHNTNRQHQREQRQHIDREAEHIHKEEGSDQGDRHRNSRDQGRSEVLQEDIDHDKHQDKGLQQGFQH